MWWIIDASTAVGKRFRQMVACYVLESDCLTIRGSQVSFVSFSFVIPIGRLVSRIKPGRTTKLEPA